MKERSASSVSESLAGTLKLFSSYWSTANVKLPKTGVSFTEFKLILTLPTSLKAVELASKLPFESVGMELPVYAWNWNKSALDSPPPCT